MTRRSNREEVRHSVPGIQVAGPEIIDGLLDRPQLAGKDDRRLTRLEQYRVLERKVVDRTAVPGSNEGFLRSCDIRIGVFTDAQSEADRLFELVLRTNQLNFTKRRPDRDEFDRLLADTRRATGYVRVRDRYGDYGICGFYSLDPAERSLTDFLFSCRILNMGVEQWLYDRLGRPSVAVVGEVASELDTEAQGSVDWITRDEALFDAEVLAAGGSGRGDGQRPDPAPSGPDGGGVRPEPRRSSSSAGTSPRSSPTPGPPGRSSTWGTPRRSASRPSGSTTSSVPWWIGSPSSTGGVRLAGRSSTPTTTCWSTAC